MILKKRRKNKLPLSIRTRTSYNTFSNNQRQRIKNTLSGNVHSKLKAIICYVGILI